MEKFICAKCGKNKAPSKNHLPGYARNKDGQKICYDCCAVIEGDYLANMAIGEKTTLYLGSSEKIIQNWPGTLRIPINSIKKGRHNIAGNRYDVWFQFRDQYYWGVQYGDYTQICHVTRVKPW